MGNSDLFWADFYSFSKVFSRVLDNLEDFLTEKKRKMHTTLEDVTIFFYFMTFIPKSHILAQKVDFQHFLHILAILEDFLTEMKKK